MAVRFDNIAPYLSLTLFKIKDTAKFEKDKLAAALKKLLRSEGKERQFSDIRTDGLDEDVEFRMFRYAEKRVPTWFLGHEIKNLDNHLVVLARHGDLLGIVSTDANALGKIVRATRETIFKDVQNLDLLTADHLEQAFLDEQIRTLWLSGAHQRTTIKPDGKVISGLELESALDPLDDQSFYYSSIRSTSGNEELKTDGRPAVIGFSAKQGKIWIGPTRTWADFAAKISTVLRQAGTRTDGKSPPVLARNETDFGRIQGPYGAAIILPEAITTRVENLEDEDRWLQQFADAVRFDEFVERDNQRDFLATAYWGDIELGRLEFGFDLSNPASIKLRVEVLSWTEDEGYEDLRGYCGDPDHFTIYFASGHTYANRGVILRRFRDMPFNDWHWVDMSVDNTSFDREKTDNGAKGFVRNIGADADRSLFGLVVRHWPGLKERGDPKGWLICDDGAMESADFIHFDLESDEPTLTLIHVKGSHSSAKNRQISVADYEVVVGQAIKNLRHIDQGLLADKLRRNSEGQLKDAVWLDGERQNDRDKVIQLLEADQKNLKRKVVVLQPRVRKSDWIAQRTKLDNGARDGQTDRLLQLDALLLGARADCFGLSAAFEVIGDDDFE